MPVTADVTTAIGAVSGALSTLSAVSEIADVTVATAEVVALATFPAAEAVADSSDAEVDWAGGLGEILAFLRFFKSPESRCALAYEKKILSVRCTSHDCTLHVIHNLLALF